MITIHLQNARELVQREKGSLTLFALEKFGNLTETVEKQIATILRREMRQRGVDCRISVLPD